MGSCCSKDSKRMEASSEKTDGKDSILLPASVRTNMEKEMDKQSSHRHLTENLVGHELGRDINEFYEINNGAILGSGMSGSVKICISKKTRTRYALKTLSKANVVEEKLPLLREEIKIMASLDHPNILRVIECFENTECIYIILELCTGHDLLTCLNKQSHISYSEKKTCDLVAEMLSALRYCHDHGVVHRDIKLENFLFETESPSAPLKLIDFGFSQHFKPKEILSRDVGSPFYVAPEVLDKSYTEKCDIWSIGVVTYILLSGEPPFSGNNNAEILHNVKYARLKFLSPVFKHISPEAIDFMSNCMNRNVNARLSSTQAHEHYWFKKHHHTSPPIAVSSAVIDNFKQFSARTRLSRICLEVIAHVLNNHQIEELRVEFAKFDVNNTGEISYNDMKIILERHSDLLVEDIKHIFEDLDVEHTGVIHYHEFIAAAVSQKEITENNMKQAFEKVSHHREYITCNDFVKLLGMDATVEEVKNMMMEAGVYHTDNIDFNDFKQIMMGGKKPVKDSLYRQHSHRLRFFRLSSTDILADAAKSASQTIQAVRTRSGSFTSMMQLSSSGVSISKGSVVGSPLGRMSTNHISPPSPVAFTGSGAEKIKPTPFLSEKY